MTTTADRPSKGVAPSSTAGYKSKYKVVGTRPIRHDGLDKVTGRAKYGADVHMPGMLQGKILRSPHAHARIISVDTSEAERLPGVKAVVTAADFAINAQPTDLGNVWANPQVTAAVMLAKGKVLYAGHAIAAVAATDAHTAEEACQRIRVEYEVLKPVLNVHDAMAPDAPLIHDDALSLREIKQRFERGEDTGKVGNVGSHLRLERGDVEQGFREADVVVKREWRCAPVHQGYIEPHSSTAYWAPDGKITVWTSTQGHFAVRSVTASILGVSEHTVKVVPLEIGGGFGGKTSTYFDPVCAVLSKKTGAPVKISMTRKEVFEGTGPGSGGYGWAKIGARKDGRLTAIQLYLALESGAFPGSPIGAGATTSLAPYKVDNLLCDAYDVIVNKQKVHAYRAPGSPQGALVIEPVIDELAEKLGMDPVELRLINATKEGDRLPSGVPMGPVGCIETEEAMKSHPHYKAPLGPNQGRGIAMGYWGNAGMTSSATLTVNADGTVSCITGSVDIGGSRPAISMQAAEVLGLTAEDMVPSVADTDSVGYTQTTGGSRTAFATGIAAISAAEDVRNQMIGRAALIWEVSPEEVGFEDGTFIHGKNPEDRLTFKQLAAQLLRTGGPISASASSSPTKIGPSFCGNMVDVEVDPETGKVQVLRYTVFQDVGQAVHPSYVEGQLQGGTVQGIGWALNEEYFFSDEGRMLNSSFLDYRMPTSLDLPMIDTVFIEVPNPGHPFGLRGVGEVGIVPPMAAIANAIHDAIGVRMDVLPMTPGAVLEALEKKESAA